MLHKPIISFIYVNKWLSSYLCIKHRQRKSFQFLVFPHRTGGWLADRSTNFQWWWCRLIGNISIHSYPVTKIRTVTSDSVIMWQETVKGKVIPLTIRSCSYKNQMSSFLYNYMCSKGICIIPTWLCLWNKIPFTSSSCIWISIGFERFTFIVIIFFCTWVIFRAYAVLQSFMLFLMIDYNNMNML